MKKIVALVLVILMTLTVVACNKSEDDTNTKGLTLLADKTPKELYSEAIDYIKSLTNYEILIESHYKTAYGEEVNEETAKTLHCSTGDTFYYSYQSEFYEEFFLHDGTMLYQNVNNVQEKMNISYSDFMKEWGSITEDGLLINLKDETLDGKLFIPIDDLYYLNLQISEAEYAEITGGSVESPVSYRVYFNENGIFTRFERSMVYYYESILVEDDMRITINNVGTTEKITAPEGAENFPIRLRADEIDLSSVESLDAFEPSTEVTEYVLLDMKIDGEVKLSDTETVENYQGKILIRLFPDVAPLSVANFQSLVGHTFYNGLTMHRVVADFVIQGGDPDGDGSGGSDNTIFGEFSSNGFTNNLSHKRGVVSMARANDPDSASSQFFICHKDATSLDGNYAAFGYVIYGMDVVDIIASLNVDESDKPTQKVTIVSATFMQKKS